MSYKVMAREWRPEVFSRVVAQEHIVTTLQNAIRLDRIAHAYLFSGPRGTGKTTTARLLAKALNCVNGPTPEPCGECEYCRSVADGKSMDVLEIDGASNRGIDEIRQLREEVGYSSSKGKHKVYIIDEVHMLTQEAFNALLKTLEEPPPHVVFVFATTEPHKVPETILSRCQRYNFRRIPTEQIVGQLQTILESEKLEAEEEALFLVGRKADGAMRDALSLLDQVRSFSDGAITASAVRDLLGIVPRDLYFELADAVLAQDGPAALKIVTRMLEEGGDVGEFTAGLLEHFRHLLVACVSGKMEDEDLPESDRVRYTEVGGKFEEDDVLRMLQVVSELELNLGRVSEPRFWLELTVMKLVKLASSESLEELMGRLNRLEDLLQSRPVAPAVSARPTSASRPGVRGSERVAPGPRSQNGPEAAPQARREPPKERPVEVVSSTRSPKDPTAEAAPPAPPQESPHEVPPQPAQPPAQPIGELTLQALQESWGRVVQGVKAKKISVGTFLAEGTPAKLDTDQLVVAFKQSNAFHSNQVKRNKETVEAVVAELFGEKVYISCEFEQNGGAGPEAREEEAPETDERVQMALRIFDGEIQRR